MSVKKLPKHRQPKRKINVDDKFREQIAVIATARLEQSLQWIKSGDLMMALRTAREAVSLLDVVRNL